MTQITRRGALAGAMGVGPLVLLGSQWPRLDGTDIPRWHDDSLSIVILETNQDAEARQSLAKALNIHHPDIPVRLQTIQGADWADFFAKIPTMVATGTPPDVCVVATRGAQLFVERLVELLNEYLARDVDQVQDYFDDVHPSLVEALMYKGSFYQMFIDLNAANIYFNAKATNRARVGYPRDDWSHDDSLGVARQMKQANASDLVPFYWTNRLWGGIVPWLYINDTSFFAEQRSSDGERPWDRSYPGHVGTFSGGFLWEHSNVIDPEVAESLEFVRALVQEGLGTSPAQGGSNELVGQLSGGSTGMTLASGLWAQGLVGAGLKPDDYDVGYFPKWRSQRHQFGAAGYAILKTSRRKDKAWEWVKFCISLEGMQLVFPAPITTPTCRLMCNKAFYFEKGPKHQKVFYDTSERPPCALTPAPPQQAVVEIALIKNVLGVVTGSVVALPAALARLDEDLTRALEV